MKNFEQFCISAFVAAFAAFACYYLVDECDYWIFGFEQIIAAVVGGVIAFVLMARYYRKENKEEQKKIEEEKKRLEEKRRKEEELKKAEEEKQKREMERQKEEMKRKQEEERKRKEEEERRRKQEEERKRKEEEDRRRKQEEERKRKEEEEMRRKQEEEKKKMEEEAKTFDWDYNIDRKTLTISGKGEMPKNWHPWPVGLEVNRIFIKNGVLSICDNAFSDICCYWDFGIDFGNTIQTIGNNIIGDEYYFCCNLLVLPDTIKSIGANAFPFSVPKCDIYIRAQNPPVICEDSFREGIFGTKINIKVPIGCYKKYVSSTNWGQYANNIEEKNVAEMLSKEELKEQKLKQEEKRKEEDEAETARMYAEIEAELRKKMGL